MRGCCCYGCMEAWKHECVSYGCVDVVTMNAWKHESMNMWICELWMRGCFKGCYKY